MRDALVCSQDVHAMWPGATMDSSGARCRTHDRLRKCHPPSRKKSDRACDHAIGHCMLRWTRSGCTISAGTVHPPEQAGALAAVRSTAECQADSVVVGYRQCTHLYKHYSPLVKKQRVAHCCNMFAPSPSPPPAPAASSHHHLRNPRLHQHHSAVTSVTTRQYLHHNITHHHSIHQR